MVKAVQRKIAVLIIMSMLVQLLVGVPSLMAEDSGDFPEEHEFVPLLDVALSPGETQPHLPEII